MPIYDYQCHHCGHIFDTLVLSTTLVSCPQCGGLSLEKLVSRPAPHARSGEIIASARSQAAREGHFSNYKGSDKPKR